MCNKGITQFYLPPTHEPYLPFLPSRNASPSCGWYLLPLRTKGWPGRVDLGGWLHTKTNVPHQDMVTHPSTSRARRRLTLLNETNAPLLHQTTTILVLDWILTAAATVSTFSAGSSSRPAGTTAAEQWWREVQTAGSDQSPGDTVDWPGLVTGTGNRLSSHLCCYLYHLHGLSDLSCLSIYFCNHIVYKNTSKWKKEFILLPHK